MYVAKLTEINKKKNFFDHVSTFHLILVTLMVHIVRYLILHQILKKVRKFENISLEYINSEERIQRKNLLID